METNEEDSRARVSEEAQADEIKQAVEELHTINERWRAAVTDRANKYELLQQAIRDYEKAMALENHLKSLVDQVVWVIVERAGLPTPNKAVHSHYSLLEEH